MTILFWEFKEDPYDVIAAATAFEAMIMRARCFDGMLPGNERPRLMERVELEEIRDCTPLSATDETFGQMLRRLDREQAERERIEEFNRRQLSLFGAGDQA